MGDQKPLTCPHNMGTYQAEEIYNRDTGETTHHWRCNGCDIILGTY